MEVVQTGDRYLYKASLFSHLEKIESESWTDKTVYITPSSLAEDSATALLAGPAFVPLIRHLGKSENGYVIFRREADFEVIEPPFSIPMDAIMEGQDTFLLEDIFLEPHTSAVLLLRLGRYAIAVLKGEDLIATKTEGRYVKNRHKAGGSSQRRFERSRERLIRELYDKTCSVAQNLLEPHKAEITKIFLGGDKHILNGFRKRCKSIQIMEDKISPRLLAVDSPNHETLLTIHREIFKSRVRTFALTASK